MLKKCRICENDKELSEFHKKKGTKDGHRNECKECVKKIQKKYKDAPDFKEKRAEYDKQRYDEKREEILERKKEYHIENREKILSDKKVYRKLNNAKIKKYLDKYREEHREEAREYVKNNSCLNSLNQQKYRENNPHVIAWRSILYSTLKRLGTKKQNKTIDELGYSAVELKEHIESQFELGMTWNNHGEWHIDHKKPVTKFDKKTDISVVYALENLQPLWAFDNLSKNNKYE